MVIFLFKAIFSFQTAKTGSKSIEKSLAILIADVAKMDGLMLLLIQLLANIGFDSLALGAQEKIQKKVIVT